MEYKIEKYKQLLTEGVDYLEYRGFKDIRFAVDVENELIKDVLQNFINSYEDTKGIRNTKFRVFLNSFQDSLQGSLINQEHWFSIDIFNKQYKFYNELDTILRDNKVIGGAEKLKNKLIAFYRFINNESYKEKYKSDFTPIFLESINSKSFYKYYELGYKFIYYSPLQEPPENDKICIMPNKEVMFNANSRNTLRDGFDFTICNEVYREDLKRFVWDNWNGAGSLNQYKKLVDFLNLSAIQQYSSKRFKLYDSNKEFDEEFLWNYRIMIKGEVENSGNVKSIIKIIRKFLKYYKNKYNVYDSDLDILNLAKLDNYNGGKVISDKDLNLIYKKFKEKEKRNPKLKIYSIVFEFFLTTKYRIGEILNFKRSWLKTIDNNTYILKYIGKTTGQCIIEDEITYESANLLLEAIKLTENIVSDKSLCGEYIFVEPHLATHIDDCKRINFSYEFHKILEELSDVLDETDYKPNNIRHTFINNVYKEGRNKGLSIERICKITGNSYKTANKHYRDNYELLDYLEALNGICISNVDIHGKILKKEVNEIKNKVKDGLGNCVSDGCKFKIGECLRCNNFVTFTNRENNFKKQVKKIDQLIAETKNDDEIEELLAYKKLVVRYLYEIKSMISNEEKKA